MTTARLVLVLCGGLACQEAWANAASDRARAFLLGKVAADGQVGAATGTQAVRETALAAEALAATGGAPELALVSSWLWSRGDGAVDVEAARLRALRRSGWADLVGEQLLATRLSPSGGASVNGLGGDDVLASAAALTALSRSPAVSAATVSRSAAALAALQRTDGSFTVAENPGSALATGAALEALGPFPNAASAVALVLAREQSSGGFGEGTARVLDTAVALRGLSQVAALAPSLCQAATGAAGYLAAQQAADGSFGQDLSLTALALPFLDPALSCGPDLAVGPQDLSWAPDPPPASGAVTLSVTVRNVGLAAAAATALRVFVNGLPVPGDVAVGALPRGASAVVTKALTLAGGSSLVRAELDPAGTSVDRDRSNNAAAVTIAVPLPGQEPDLSLAPGDVVASTLAPTAGQVVTVSFTVKNLAPWPAPVTAVRALIAGQSLAPVAGGDVWVGPFGAGGSASGTLRFSLPAGAQAVMIAVDPDATAADAQRGNNQVPLAFNVGAGGLYDFAIYAGDVRPDKASPIIGERVRITVSVANPTQVDAPPAPIALFDGDPAQGGALLGVVTPPGGIGYSYWYDAQFSWTATGVGAHTLWAVADPAGAFAERDEGNNRQSVALTVQNPPAADLSIVASDIVSLAASPIASQPFDVAATVRNLGGRPAGNVSVQFYDGDPATTGVAVGPLQRLGLVPVAGQAVATLARWATTQGPHDLYAVVDVFDEILELNETNNRAFRTINVGPNTGNLGPPNLLVLAGNFTSIPAPGALQEAVNVNLRLTVTNNGQSQAPQFTVRFFAGNPTTGGRLIDEAVVGPLASGANLMVSRQPYLPKGNYEVYATLDSTLAIAETSEADNVATLTVSVAPLPMLESYLPVAGNAQSPAVGDLTGDGLPEIVFLRIQAGSKITAVRKDAANNWTQVWEYTPTPVADSLSPPALGALSAARGAPPNIVTVQRNLTGGNRLLVLGANGTLAWSAALPTTTAPISIDWQREGSPRLGDVSGDGVPDILVTQLGDSRLHVVDGRNGAVLWSALVGSITTLPYATAVDLDPLAANGVEVLVADSTQGVYAFRKDGSQLWQAPVIARTPFTCPAIGCFSWNPNRLGVVDVDGDGLPEIAANGIYDQGLINWDGTMRQELTQTRTINTSWSGPVAAPLAAGALPSLYVSGDFDVVHRMLYSPAAGAMTPLWSVATGLAGWDGNPALIDVGGGAMGLLGRTGSGFVGMNAQTGANLFSAPFSAASVRQDTAFADLDGDGHVEMVAAVNGSTGLLMVFGNDAAWGPARPVWTQDAFHASLVYDDLSFTGDYAPYLTHNSWRAAVVPRAVADLPDLTVGPAGLTLSNLAPVEGQPLAVTAVVRNRGRDDAAWVKVRLYDGDPKAGGVAAGPDAVVPLIRQGQSGAAQLLWLAKGGTHTLWVVADPDDAITEGIEYNNQASVTVAGTSPTGAFSLSLGVAPATVGPEASVTISGGVAAGSDELVGAASLYVLDPAGQVVGALGGFSVAGPDGGTQLSAVRTWSSGRHQPGVYRAVLDFAPQVGTASSAQASFTITPEVAVQAAIAADRLAYGPGELVAIALSAKNAGRNAPAAALAATVELRAPDDSLVTSWPRALGVLEPLAELGWTVDHSLGRAAPGRYKARLQIKDGAAVVAQAEVGFDVLSTADTAAGLAASLAVAPQRPWPGTTVRLGAAVQNLGNAPVAALPLRLELLRPAALDGGALTPQAAVASYPLGQLDLALDASQSFQATHAVAEAVGEEILCLLVARLPSGQDATLARAAYTVAVLAPWDAGVPAVPVEPPDGGELPPVELPAAQGCCANAPGGPATLALYALAGLAWRRWRRKAGKVRR